MQRDKIGEWSNRVRWMTRGKKKKCFVLHQVNHIKRQQESLSTKPPAMLLKNLTIKILVVASLHRTEMLLEPISGIYEFFTESSKSAINCQISFDV